MSTVTRRRLAAAPPLRGTRPSADRLRRGPGARAQPGRRPGLRRGRARDRQPRLRWIRYQDVRRRRTRASCRSGRVFAGMFGAPPLGWYTGRDRPTPAGSSSNTAASSTTAIATPTTCRTGSRRSNRIWSFPTRSTPTTCASRAPPGSAPARTSSTTCATRSTPFTPKARRAQDALGRAALPPRGTSRAQRLAGSLPRPRAGPSRSVDRPTRRDRPALETTAPPDGSPH